VVARKTAKGHLGEILPQGDLDDGTVGQLLKELTGEMDRPSDRKRRIWGYGDLTWMLEGIFSSGMMLSSRWSGRVPDDARRVSTSSAMAALSGA
jgi:hypothetical protein